jgi:hypothetical protein
MAFDDDVGHVALNGVDDHIPDRAPGSVRELDRKPELQAHGMPHAARATSTVVSLSSRLRAARNRATSTAKPWPRFRAW